MTRSNRTLNRIILLVLGLTALAAAAALALPLVPRSTLSYRLPRLTVSTTLEWSVAASAVVIAVVAIAWIVTRGRGRTRTAIDGELTLDARVLDELLKDALSSRPDVIAGSAVAYRVRRATVLQVRIEARRGADLRRLTDAVHTAIDQLDTAIGDSASDRLPVLVHISSGLRASMAREQRVA